MSRLRLAGCVFAEDEADLLLAAATGPALEALVTRRVAGEPLEHLLGWVDFAGLTLAVDAGVFVPRQRTLHLASLAVGLATAVAEPVVVDLCCGVGAVAAVVADRVPHARVLAADVDPAAVGCARRNLPDAEVSCGDLFEALPPGVRGHVDVLACNAPYVPTGEISSMPTEARVHEPAVALDGGVDGLDVHRRVAATARDWLTPGGHLLVELAQSQLAAGEALMRSAGLVPRVDRDDERGAAVLVARRAQGVSGTCSP